METWGFGLCFLYLRNVQGHGWNHEGLGIEIDFSLPAVWVVRALNRTIEWGGKHLAIRVDNFLCRENLAT